MGLILFSEESSITFDEGDIERAGGQGEYDFAVANILNFSICRICESLNLKVETDVMLC